MSNFELYVGDRSSWPAGPWSREPDKLSWKTEAGLPGMIVRNGMGGLCGYVAVVEGHMAFGLGCGDVSVDVHGGITYGSACAGHICHVPEPGEPDHVWWLGFDCAHSFDAVPGEIAWDRKHGYATRGEYRDVDYVTAEVEKLAAQLARMA